MGVTSKKRDSESKARFLKQLLNYIAGLPKGKTSMYSVQK
jgi:hypothetical protein